jgi:hypothetical protein
MRLSGGLPRNAAVVGYLAVARHLPWPPPETTD